MFTKVKVMKKVIHDLRMWQQTTIVTRFEPGRVWLKSEHASACSSCSHHQNCGTSSLAKWLPIRELKLETSITFEVGDKVLLGIEEQSMFGSVFLMYFLPLLFMLLLIIGTPRVYCDLKRRQVSLQLSP